MRLPARALLLLAAASGLSAAPALAQESGLVRIDPCTGKPYPPGGPTAAVPDGPGSARPGVTPAGPGTPAAAAQPGAPAASAGTPSASAGTPSASATVPSASTPAAGTPSAISSAGVTVDAPRACVGAGHAADPDAARRNRQALRLGRGTAPGQVRLGPAASVSVPTAFGVDAGELFVGASYQGRTRYTEEDDAAFVAGLGLGTRRIVAAEVALTSYSTFRGAPFETGGISVRLHRALPGNTSVAVGWENAVLWGNSDDRGSLYAVGTRIVPVRRDPTRPFGVAVFTLGVGNGRFRFEDDDADGNETVNVFAAAGVRVNEPLSLVADWTGQDVNVAASLTPIRRLPLVLTAGLADLTGSAGDGARFILSLGYGLSLRQPF